MNTWENLNAALVAKIMREFHYEGILTLVEGKAGKYSLALPTSDLCAKGEPGIFGDVFIDARTIEWNDKSGKALALDVIAITMDIAKMADVAPFTLAYLIKEIQATLFVDRELARAPLTNAMMMAEPPSAWESHLTGHPWVVMSKGRFGFRASEHQRYSPEWRASFPLRWVGVKRQWMQSAHTDAKPIAHYISGMVTEAEQATFRAKIASMGEQADEFQWIPVHPWQWDNVIQQQFLPQLATGEIIDLGEGMQEYRPMQSLRTLYAVNDPGQAHIKLALSILNTSVYRGIDPLRARLAPTLTGWLQGKLAKDPYLAGSHGLVVIGEPASLAVTQPYYAAIEGAPYHFHDLLACIWRESPETLLAEGEQAVSLGALTHADAAGTPLVKTLIGQSGLSAKDWLTQFFRAAVLPVYHAMCKHGIAFNAHGENSFVVLNKGRPVRAAMKDLVDDVYVAEAAPESWQDMPKEIWAEHGGVIAPVPDEVLVHFLYTSMFVCCFRYISRVMAKMEHGVTEKAFYRSLRDVIRDYQSNHPELKARFEALDVLAPEMPKVCVNRVRLFTHGYGDSAERPTATTHGMLANPLGAR